VTAAETGFPGSAKTSLVDLPPDCGSRLDWDNVANVVGFFTQVSYSVYQNVFLRPMIVPESA